VLSVPTFGNFLTVLTGWGHSWVVQGLIVEFPFRRGHYVSRPVLFRLYVHQKTAAGKRLRYRARPEWAVEMLARLCRRHENRRFHVMGDSTYGGQSVLAHLPDNCDLTTRLDLDAPGRRRC